MRERARGRPAGRDLPPRHAAPCTHTHTHTHTQRASCAAHTHRGWPSSSGSSWQRASWPVGSSRQQRQRRGAGWAQLRTGLTVVTALGSSRGQAVACSSALGLVAALLRPMMVYSRPAGRRCGLKTGRGCRARQHGAAAACCGRPPGPRRTCCGSPSCWQGHACMLAGCGRACCARCRHPNAAACALALPSTTSPRPANCGARTPRTPLNAMPRDGSSPSWLLASWLRPSSPRGPSWQRRPSCLAVCCVSAGG
jgi:hypothetical protein